MTSDAPLPINRRSIIDRAKKAGLDPDTVLRDVAYHQLLARTVAHAPDAFMVKGAQALRTRGVTSRATKDLDMRASAREVETALASLYEAMELDLGDGIIYQEARAPQELAGAQTGDTHGVRVTIAAFIGGRPLHTIGIDVVVGRAPSGRIDMITMRLPVDLAGTADVSIGAYPVEDHIADKVCAAMTTYASGPSTRTRDLYDLCALALRSSPDAAALATALEEEWTRRRVEPPTSFAPPRFWHEKWKGLLAHDPDAELPNDSHDAVALAQSLVDPVLTGNVVRGTWNSVTRFWPV